MAISKKQLNEKLRTSYMEMVRQFLVNNNEEVLITGSNEFAIPCVDSEGNDEFMVLTFKVPTGSRDGEAYDGYEEAEAYAEKIAEKKAKAEKAKADKEKKIARDKLIREQKAKNKT